MTNIEQNHAFINKACKETLDKYGDKQVSFAMKELLQNNNPKCFTGSDNKANMFNIPKEEIEKYMLFSILTNLVVKTKKGYAQLLAPTTYNVNDMSVDDVALMLEEQTKNYGTGKVLNDMEGILKTDNVLGNKIVDTFIDKRYYNPQITENDFLSAQFNDPYVQQLYNSIYSDNSYVQSTSQSQK